MAVNFKKTKVHASLMLAFGGSLAFGSAPLFAQQQQQLDRVEVTGSLIKRIDAETCRAAADNYPGRYPGTGQDNASGGAAQCYRRQHGLDSDVIHKRFRFGVGRRLAARPGRQFDAGFAQRPSHDDLWPR